MTEFLLLSSVPNLFSSAGTAKRPYYHRSVPKTRRPAVNAPHTLVAIESWHLMARDFTEFSPFFLLLIFFFTGSRVAGGGRPEHASSDAADAKRKCNAPAFSLLMTRMTLSLSLSLSLFLSLPSLPTTTDTSMSFRNVVTVDLYWGFYWQVYACFAGLHRGLLGSCPHPEFHHLSRLLPLFFYWFLPLVLSGFYRICTLFSETFMVDGSNPSFTGRYVVISNRFFRISQCFTTLRYR